MLVEIRKRRGATVARRVTYSGVSSWRKHGRDRAQTPDETIVLLDLFAHRPIQYGPTVRVRKAR